METTYSAIYGNSNNARSTGVAASQGYTVQESEKSQIQGKMITGQVATPIVNIAPGIYGARVAMVNGKIKKNEFLCQRTERKLENDNRASVCNSISYVFLFAYTALIYLKRGEINHCLEHCITYDDECDYNAATTYITLLAPLLLGLLTAELCKSYYETNASNIAEVAKASTYGSENIVLDVMKGETCDKVILKYGPIPLLHHS